jgi:small ligand-binding sensory domain FIST
VHVTATRLADDTWHFAGWPDRIGFDPRALLLLADPFTFPAEEFLAWLHHVRPGLPVIGGNVSGGRGPGGTTLAVGERVVTAGATGVILGAGVDIETVVSQGCRAYGSPLTVTRSDRNVIYEVAGMPAMECMVDQIRSSLDPADIAGIEANGLFVGRLIDEYVEDPGPGDFLIRTVVGADRTTGAVAVDDRVPVGSTVRFHLRDAETADRELATLLEGHQANAALMFSCNGRGTRLFDDAHHDALMIEGAVGPIPLAGFLAAGEIGPIGGHNFVHAFTASVALLRDR